MFRRKILALVRYARRTRQYFVRTSHRFASERPSATTSQAIGWNDGIGINLVDEQGRMFRSRVFNSK
jgi:hypothetical protein